MPIVVTCPSCSATLRAPDAAAGKRVKCSKCTSTIEVPADDLPPVLEEDFTDERRALPPAAACIVARRRKRPLFPLRLRKDRATEWLRASLEL